MQMKKLATIAIVLSFLVSMMAMISIPSGNAALTLYPYITANPNPVGVGQQVVIVFGFTFPTRGLGFLGFDGWTVKITDPDGKTTTLGPFNADSTGSTFANLTPDKLGNYSMTAHYPGGKVDFATTFNQTVSAADTNTFVLTVQQEPITYPSAVPLPTAYWTFPIYGENDAWTNIAGNWLMPGYDTSRQFDWGSMNGPYNPYSTVPTSTHILWTKKTLFGGVLPGSASPESPFVVDYYTGSAYVRQLQPPIIINGRLYWKEMNEPRMGWHCTDLTNGEDIWFMNGTYPSATGTLVMGQDAQPTLGQILTVGSRNFHGGMAYLWSTTGGALPTGTLYGTTWAVWDAFTGSLQFTIKNCPVESTDGFTLTFFQDRTTGSLLTYVLENSQNSTTLVKWNSTRLMDQTISQTLGGYYSARPAYNLDWRLGIEWNVTLPSLGPPILESVATNATNINQNLAYYYYPALAIAAWDPKDPSVLIITNQTRGMANNPDAYTDMAVSGIDGHVIWQKTRNEGTWEIIVGGRAMSIADGIYVNFRKETRQAYAYSIATGEKLWISDPRSDIWGIYIMGGAIINGKVFWIAYDGELWANDAASGKLLWKWGPVKSGYVTPYSVYPLYGGITAAADKIIVTNGEHSADSPLYRGEQMYCINMSNGAEIWRMPGWWQQPVIANGLIISPNCYDGQDYCFGKGPTATTVSAPDVSVPQGDSIVIKGMVTDISPGTKQLAVALNYPQGVSAVSEDSMNPWMQYLYQQKPKPTNTTGVLVTLSVLDANNNCRDIGTTTTDSTGTYSYVWQPDIPGKYTLTALFSGSDSYYGSSGATSFNVATTKATAPPSIAPQVASEPYFAPAVIGIIIAIIVVGAAVVLLLRKRP